MISKDKKEWIVLSLVIIMSFAFAAILMSGIVTYVEYDIYLHGSPKATVVLDSDFSESYLYLIEFKDSIETRRYPLKGVEKSTEIMPGDSVMTLISGGNIKLLYFFESIYQPTDSSDTQYIRLPIDEYRRPISNIPSKELPIWSPVICALSIIAFIYSWICINKLQRKNKKVIK